MTYASQRKQARASRRIERIVRVLRASPFFGTLPSPALRSAAAAGRVLVVAPSHTLIREGEVATTAFVLLVGQVRVTRGNGAGAVRLAVAQPGSVLGEMALLCGTARSASVVATRRSIVLALEADVMQALLAEHPGAAPPLLRVVAGRLAAAETALLRNERLVALGTLAAGVAHELNNPAAALGRAAHQLAAAVERLRAASPGAVSTPAPDTRAGVSDFDGADADAEADIAEELRDRRIAGAAALAQALVSAGWRAPALAAALDASPAGDDARFAAWLAADAEIAMLVREIGAAAAGVGAVVDAIRTHSHLDREPLTEVDLRESVDAALLLLRRRTHAAVRVIIDAPATLPRPVARAGELGQVWTNLAANALDAMNEHGTLRIRLRARGDDVFVDVEDDGPGIPRSVRHRIFDPFFTTRAPGAGTGLGLHIVRSIVVDRHHGRVAVRSRPGRTVFRVTLPLRPPEDSS